MRVTSPGLNNNLIVKSGLGSIQSGDVFSVKIIENRNGLIKASVKGRIITVKSSLNLSGGQVLKVKAGWSGGTLILKPVDSGAKLKSIISGFNIPADAAAVHLFRAAGRAGLVLKDDIIKIIKRFLRGHKKLSAEEARAAAELLKKGLYPENLIALICGGEDSGERSRKKSLLFNHLQDRNELWFIIPFKFKTDSRILEGSLRIQKLRNNHKTEKAIIAVRDGQTKYYFFLDHFSSEKRKMYIISEGELDDVVREEIKTVLPEILGNMSIEIDDNIREKCVQDESFDGFSLSSDIGCGIEEVV